MKDEIIKLRKEGFTYSQIANKLNCSKTTVAKYCKIAGKHSYSNVTEEEIIKMQQYYDKVKSLKEVASKFGRHRSTLRNYIKITYIKSNPKQRRQNGVKAVTKRRKKVKLLAVEYLGGECEMCGYDKCVDVLEFHHINESKKEFAISTGGYTRAWEKVKKELDKCALLCANCHRELHAGLIKIG